MPLLARTCQPDVTAVVNQHVFRLQVTEDDVEVVQVFERKHGFGGEELGLFVSKSALLLLLDVRKHFTPVDEFKDHVQTPFVLEVVRHLDDKVVVGGEENVLFVVGVLDLHVPRRNSALVTAGCFAFTGLSRP